METRKLLQPSSFDVESSINLVGFFLLRVFATSLRSTSAACRMSKECCRLFTACSADSAAWRSTLRCHLHIGAHDRLKRCILPRGGAQVQTALVSVSVERDFYFSGFYFFSPKSLKVYLDK